MARLVRLEATGPVKIDPAEFAAKNPPGKLIAICACGISKQFPLCDGSHKLTRDEAPGCCYRYDPETLERSAAE